MWRRHRLCLIGLAGRTEGADSECSSSPRDVRTTSTSPGRLLQCAQGVALAALGQLVLWPLALGAATVGADLERLAQLRETDPQAALVQAEELWEARSGELDVGSALLASLNAAGENARALELTDELLGRRLPAAREVEFLAAKLEAIESLEWSHELDELAQRSQALARRVGFDEAIDKHLTLVAYAYYEQANYERTAELYEQVIELRGERADSRQKWLLGNLGAVYAQNGRYPEAIDVLLRALAIAEELGEDEPTTILRNIGGLHINLGRYEESLIYTRRALAAVDPDSSVAASLLGNVGVAMQHLERFDEAQESYEQALEISDALGVENSTSLNNLAYLLHQQGHHAKSLDMLERALAIKEKNGQWDTVAVIRKNQGENWVALGDRSRAAELFEESRRLYVKHDLRSNRLELYPVMIDNLEVLGRYQRALELMREFKELYDATVSVESAERIAELEAKFDLERNRSASDAQIQALENSQEIERGVRVVLLSVLGLLVVIGFLLVRALHFRGRANQALEGKSEEIADQASKLQVLNDSLVRQSREDELTGLLNRRFVSAHLKSEVPRLRRVVDRGGRVEQLVIVADLDHFKSINDVYGHAAGDRVLKAFAQTLKSVARESDFCVRWGGEEFLWLCPGVSVDDGAKLCARLLDAVESLRISVRGEVVSPTISIGMAPFPLWESKISWESSLAAADAALYEAKRQGRNRWYCARPNRGFSDGWSGTNKSLEALLSSGELMLEPGASGRRKASRALLEGTSLQRTIWSRAS